MVTKYSNFINTDTFISLVGYLYGYRSIRLELKQQVSDVQQKFPNLVPGLAIVQVGGRDDSNVYIRMKIRAAAEIGITAQHVQLPRTVTQSELLAKVIQRLCDIEIGFHVKIKIIFSFSRYSWMS